MLPVSRVWTKLALPRRRSGTYRLPISDALLTFWSDYLASAFRYVSDDCVTYSGKPTSGVPIPWLQWDMPCMWPTSRRQAVNRNPGRGSVLAGLLGPSLNVEPRLEPTSGRLDLGCRIRVYCA
ncbi:hypothetical protein VTK26DRAFT_6886 [Humicola hyalothermophila]